MIDKYRNQKTYYDSCKKYSHKIFQRKFFKKIFQIFVLPKISSQESQETYDDNLFPHPDYFPDISIKPKSVGDQSLEKKLKQKSDKKYFCHESKCFDEFIIVHSNVKC